MRDQHPWASRPVVFVLLLALLLSGFSLPVRGWAARSHTAHHKIHHKAVSKHHALARSHAKTGVRTHSAVLAAHPKHAAPHRQLATAKGSNKHNKLMKQGKVTVMAHAPALKQPRQNALAMMALNTGSSGVLHRRWHWKSPHGGPLLVNMLVIQPGDSDIEIRPVLSNTTHLHGKAKLVQLASRDSGALAAVNASYFKPDSGLPIGLVMVNHELMSGPLYRRTCLGISPQGTFQIAQLEMKGQLHLNNGNTLAIRTVNQPRVANDAVVLYSSKWGHTAPAMPKHGVQVQITNDTVTAVSTHKPLAIPEEGWVLSGPNTGLLATLAMPGSPMSNHVTLELSTSPDWSPMQHAISGGPYLVKNGQVYVDSAAQRIRMSPSENSAPRTAAGITASGHLLLVTVDGRQKKVSVGLTLKEMAQLMRKLGAVEAMNLDGGGSTQMVVAGRLVNSPSVKNGAAVSTALAIFKRDRNLAVRPLDNKSEI